MKNTKTPNSTSATPSRKNSTSLSRITDPKSNAIKSEKLLVTDRLIKKHLSPAMTNRFVNDKDTRLEEIEKKDWSDIFKPFLNSNTIQIKEPKSSPNPMAKVKLLVEKVVSDTDIRSQIRSKSPKKDSSRSPDIGMKNIHKNKYHIEMGINKLSPLQLTNQKSNFQVKIKPKSGVSLVQKSKHMHWLKQQEDDQLKSKQSKVNSLLATLKSTKHKTPSKGNEDTIPISTMSSSRINNTINPDKPNYSYRSLSPRVASPGPITRKFVKEEMAFLKGAVKYNVPNFLPKIRAKKHQGKVSLHMNSAMKIISERFDNNQFALLADISFKEKSQIPLEGEFKPLDLLQESTLDNNLKPKEVPKVHNDNLGSSRFFMESSLRAVQKVNLEEDVVDEFKLSDLNKGDLNILKKKIRNLLVDIFILTNPLFENLSNLTSEGIIPFIDWVINTIEQHIKHLNEAIAGLSKTINVSALFWELLNFEKHDFILSDERHRQFLSITPEKILSDRRMITFNLINIFRVFYLLHFESQDLQLFSTIEVNRLLTEIELYLNVNLEKFQDKKITPKKLLTEDKIKVEDFLILCKLTDLTPVERADPFLACIADYTFDVLMFNGFREYIAFHENPNDDGTRYRNLIYEFLFNNKKNVVLESILLELTRVRGLMQ